MGECKAEGTDFTWAEECPCIRCEMIADFKAQLAQAREALAFCNENCEEAMNRAIASDKVRRVKAKEIRASVYPPAPSDMERWAADLMEGLE